MKKIFITVGLFLFSVVPSFMLTQPNHAAAVEMKNGWVYEQNQWYYYQNDNMVKEWILTNNQWYYLNPQTGIMQTGWVNYNNKWYYMDPLTGIMRTGWVNYNNKWYYHDSSGAMNTGWVFVSNKWYFLNSQGDMMIGWLYQGGNWYYLEPNGDMAVGWFVDYSNKYYYAYSSGAMAINTRIDGYYVGYTGQWIQDTTYPYYLKGVLLVNKHHGLPGNYGNGENPEARAAFEQMKSAAAKQGITLHIASGFRSYEYQKNLYWRYVSIYGQAQADRFSAYPGYSEHQSGLAFDLGGSNPTLWVNSGFDNTSEAKWLAAYGYKFGFILRYPPGKEHITGYMHESWHFRYLGVDLASKVYASRLTLEEYLGEY